MLKKLILATAFIYVSAEAAYQMSVPEDTCQGWKCAEVSGPDDYAVWIPEEQAFLPCDKWSQYVNIGNKSVLK